MSTQQIHEYSFSFAELPITRDRIAQAMGYGITAMTNEVEARLDTVEEGQDLGPARGVKGGQGFVHQQ